MKFLKYLYRFNLTATILLLMSTQLQGQSPDLGSAVHFALFSSNGAVKNTGTSHLTGKAGTNNGSSTDFGNVNGGMHDGDGVSAQAAADLLVAYNELNDLSADFFAAPLLGNGQILTPGIYYINGAATLNLDLILDAENNTDAVFIFLIDGPLSTATNSSVELRNQAQACKVYWKVEGLVDMAAGTSMKGSIIANNAGINMNSGNVLEGRALSTNGAINIDGVKAYTPIGCSSPVLKGPEVPTFGEAGCYGIFSADGPVQNAGISNVMGDVGCNVGLTTGFDSLLVSGNIHPIPDNSTATAASDLLVAYNYLNELAHDIELLYPAQFGGNLVLTPHTYLLDAATTFQDTIYLNAQGVNDAVFVFQIEGALSTGTYATVMLTNGTKAENVYWLVNGAVHISDYAVFNGTIVAQGAIDILTGVTLNGRALTGVGAIGTAAIQGNADIGAECETIIGGPTALSEAIENTEVSIYPNPIGNSVTVTLQHIDGFQKLEMRLYTILGKEIMNEKITLNSTTLDTSSLSSGVYIYRVIGDNQTIKSGKLIAR